MNKIYLISVLLLGLNAPAFGQFPGTPNFFNAAAAGPVYSCGAFVSAGVFKVFMCHNLGADASTDPNIPIQAIYGNFHQWGRPEVAANAYTPDGPVGGWYPYDAYDGTWTDGSKTGSDPCPAGFRVPTISQWGGVIANNTVSRTGSWANDGNFSTAISFGPNASTKTLTLPAAGARASTDGTMVNRGTSGYYWSSTDRNPYSWHLGFNGYNVAANFYDARTNGFSVRCVSE